MTDGHNAISGPYGSSGSSGSPGFSGDSFYVPCCGEKVKYAWDRGWVCPTCDKSYLTKDLITIEEWRNKNRIKLIEKMLNGK